MRSFRLNHILNYIIVFLILNIILVLISRIKIESKYYSLLIRFQAPLRTAIFAETEAPNIPVQQLTTTVSPDDSLFDEIYSVFEEEPYHPSTFTVQGTTDSSPNSSKPPLKPQTPKPKPPKRKPQIYNNFLTANFGATCYGGGLSNILFEFVSVFGIARSVNRKAFLNGNSSCVMAAARKVSSYFPRLLAPFGVKYFNNSAIVREVGFGHKCCTYQNVTQLKNYSDQFISLSGLYLQSFKYFDAYKKYVRNMFTFANKDVKEAKQISDELFYEEDSSAHKICVHIRRGDFIGSPLHQHSTQEFTKSAVRHVRGKFATIGVRSVVTFLGDDRKWSKELFINETWARFPELSTRPTVDYAFFARYCQSIILTASASTFGFWSAYLSSAENIYYNQQFDKNNALISELKPADFFPSDWIALRYSNRTGEIDEIVSHSRTVVEI